MENEMHPNTIARIHSRKAQKDAASGSRLRRWLNNAFMRWQRRRMIEALQRLDDRLLHDIGISRGEIPSVVEGFDREELGMKPIASAMAEKEVAKTQDDYKLAA
jgi:uncharacterized protein YjiS (DUF1127 family)